MSKHMQSTLKSGKRTLPASESSLPPTSLTLSTCYSAQEQPLSWFLKYHRCTTLVFELHIDGNMHYTFYIWLSCWTLWWWDLPSLCIIVVLIALWTIILIILLKYYFIFSQIINCFNPGMMSYTSFVSIPSTDPGTNKTWS